MKELVIQASRSVPVQTVCTAILSEISTGGLSGMYDRVMDTLAQKIANYMYELEQNDKKERRL